MRGEGGVIPMGLNIMARGAFLGLDMKQTECILKQMVASTENFKFGLGVYTLAEAALYSRTSVRTLERWFLGNSSGERVFSPIHSDGQKTISFLDFVQALAIRDLRRIHKLSLHKIRFALQKAEQDYGITDLFARKHSTFLFDKDIFIFPEGSGLPVQISGKQADQIALKIVEPYLKDISYDATSGLAQTYQAFKFGEVTISMNPQKHFGEPIFEDCGYTALSLWEALKTEGSFEAAGEAYGVTAQHVEAAFKYFDHLDMAA